METELHGGTSLRASVRSEELDAVVAAVSGGGSAYVSGEAGIGKTVLLYEARQRLSEDGYDIIITSGYEATSMVPLAPLLRLCPPGVTDAGAAVISELYRRSRHGPVAVFVDDAHLLDDATAAIVRQIAGIDATGLAVAVRSGEPAPPQIASIVDGPSTTELVLEPLSRSKSVTLIEDSLGPVSQEVSDWLWQQSRGHPLYLRELIIAARETGALRREMGEWRAVEGPVWTSRLHALIARRLSDLEPDRRRVVEVVAIAGELPLDVATSITGLDEIAELAQRSILDASKTQVRIQHPLFAESVLAGLHRDRLRDLRLWIAEAIEESVEPDPLRSLSLRLDAGDDPSLSELLEGCDLALSLRLPEVAERFARASLIHGPTGGGPLSLALAMQRRWEEAELSFGRAVEAAPEVHARTALIERWIQLNFEYRDDPGSALRAVDEAKEVLGEHVSPDIELTRLRALMFLGDLDSSIKSHDEFAAEYELTPEQFLKVAVGVSTSASHSGAFERGVSFWDAVEREASDAIEVARLRSVAVLSRAWMEGPTEVAADLADLVHFGETSDDPDLALLAEVYVGMIMNEALRPAEALSHLERALDLTKYALHRRHVPILLAELARCSSQMRDGSDDAGRYLEMVFALPPEARRLCDAPAMLAVSRLDRLAGRDPRPALHKGLEAANARSARAHEVYLLRELAHLGEAAEVEGAMSETVASMDGRVAPLFGTEVAAMATGDAAALDAVAREAELLGVDGLAIDAAAAASTLHHDGGRSLAAFASEWRCRRMVEKHSEYVSVATAEMSPLLSNREYQVASMVVDGASSSEVADRLFISPRTVDSHLRRIYRRLGISGREELASLTRDSDVGTSPSAGADYGATFDFRNSLTP